MTWTLTYFPLKLSSFGPLDAHTSGKGYRIDIGIGEKETCKQLRERIKKQLFILIGGEHVHCSAKNLMFASGNLLDTLKSQGKLKAQYWVKCLCSDSCLRAINGHHDAIARKRDKLQKKLLKDEPETQKLLRTTPPA